MAIFKFRGSELASPIYSICQLNSQAVSQLSTLTNFFSAKYCCRCTMIIVESSTSVPQYLRGNREAKDAATRTSRTSIILPRDHHVYTSYQVTTKSTHEIRHARSFASTLNNKHSSVPGIQGVCISMPTIDQCEYTICDGPGSSRTHHTVSPKLAEFSPYLLQSATPCLHQGEITNNKLLRST